MTTEETEQFREFLNQLLREEHRATALNEIKNLITYKPPIEVSATIRNVGISKIVQCLNVQDKAQVDLTCEVLNICFGKFEPGEVVKNYTSYIMYLLRHEKSCVRKLAAHEVYKAVALDQNVLPVPQYIDVYVAVAQLVIDSDIGVANKAILITSNLPFEAYPKVLEEMKIALEYNARSKCNAYEVIVNVGSKNCDLCELCCNQGYVDHMISQLHSDDVLYQLNILELISRMAVTAHGLGFLVKQGALKEITDLIVALPNNPLGGLLTPGFLKFIGLIAHYYPREIIDKYPAFIELMFETMESGDPTILPVALDTFGFIGTTIEGKLCLTALGSKFILAVEKLGPIIKNSPTETKIRALQCYARLICVDQDPNIPINGPIDHRVTLMTREWFRSFSSSPSSIELLFEICKNPFPEIRLGGLALLDAVCQHQWGEELVARTAGFTEYLMDRTTDFSKVIKEVKYDIIKRLSNSIAFDPSIATRLRTYVEQGPFYTESALEVAMEEGE